MLIVKVEIWPGGEFDRAFEITRLGIANVTRPAAVCDYELTALLQRDSDERVHKSRINAHVRSDGWIPLVRRATMNMFLEDRTLPPIPYDDPVAELLRKGHRV